MHLMTGGQLALVAALLGAPAAVPACEFEFAYTNQESSPFLSGRPPDQPLPGLAVDIVRAAAASIDCSVTFVRRPGQRVLSEVGAGMHAGALMFSYSDERARKLAYPIADGALDPSRRLARMTYYLYRPLGGKLEWDGSKLSHVDGDIGANLGYAVVADLRKLGIKVEEVGTTAQNLEKMQRGRLAGYAMHDYGVDPLLRAGRYSKIEKLPIALSTRDYYLAFSRAFYQQHREQAERMWDAIAQLREQMMDERIGEYAP
jgi:polar amino acid transport system substrate-binding protein